MSCGYNIIIVELLPEMGVTKLIHATSANINCYFLYIASKYSGVRIQLKMGGNLTHPVVDLSSKVAIVTGGNTGIGYETAKALAEMGAHTFIACRSQERAAAVS